MGHVRERTAILVVAALGVVFGDIGTSPLYTLKACFMGRLALSPTPGNVLGLLSLICWSLILVVCVKYALFVLQADDDGEGGDFAMLALLHEKMGAGLERGLVLAVFFGSALLYGDGLITPVISVLSAVEGLKVVTEAARPVVVPLTCAILFLLFKAQSHGTGRLGKLFGPLMIIWFAAIATFGLLAIVRMPLVLQAVNPVHGIRFFLDNGLRGFFTLGLAVLCVTGCEALYVDMGHFGARAIRISWYLVAFPALLLNYLGQGALILIDPRFAREPFYGLVPRALLGPMVVLATMATIIASQAIISGVFSLTRQAIQLGFLPRMRIVHTSGMVEGQVYLPDVNGLMMVATIALALHFQRSDNLADAYGTAVTGSMLVTSVMFYVVSRRIWHWSAWRALPLCLLFWVLDATYFCSCLQKFTDGGWLPLGTALVIMLLMVAWWDGWKALALRVMSMTVPKETFMEKVAQGELIRLPGTGVFLSTFAREVPPMLLQYVNQTRALYETLVLLSVVTDDGPEVDESRRVEIDEMGHGVYRVAAHYGFMEAPDIPDVMARVKAGGLPIDLDEVTYYLGRISLVDDPDGTMPRWRRWLFTFMLRNSLSGSSYLKIPPSKVMEIGVQTPY